MMTEEEIKATEEIAEEKGIEVITDINGDIINLDNDEFNKMGKGEEDGEE